jgi:hypothetical protein
MIEVLEIFLDHFLMILTSIELSQKIMRDESKYILNEKKHPTINYEESTGSPKVHRVPRNEVGSGYQGHNIVNGGQSESRTPQTREQQITPGRGHM